MATLATDDLLHFKSVDDVSLFVIMAMAARVHLLTTRRLERMALSLQVNCISIPLFLSHHERTGSAVMGAEVPEGLHVFFVRTITPIDGIFFFDRHRELECCECALKCTVFKFKPRPPTWLLIHNELLKKGP